MNAIETYKAECANRREIISRNASLRMRRLPTVPVPPKPTAPVAPFAYEPDGTYAGRLNSPEELPAGYILRWEPVTA